MSLELSRKRAKEIKKLRKQADKLWAEQRAVSLHAAEIARQAGHTAKAYGSESLRPAAERVVHRGVDAGRDTLSKATKGWNSSVVPAIASGLGSFAALAQVSKDDRVKDAIKNVRRYATVPEVSPSHHARSGPNAWQWVLIGVGAVAVASAAYAAWQTLRADDDLWIPDAEDSAFDAPRRDEASRPTGTDTPAPRPAAARPADVAKGDAAQGGVADGPEAGSPQS